MGSHSALNRLMQTFSLVQLDYRPAGGYDCGAVFAGSDQGALRV
jgi:hypothetical protein